MKSMLPRRLFAFAAVYFWSCAVLAQASPAQDGQPRPPAVKEAEPPEASGSSDADELFDADDFDELEAALQPTRSDAASTPPAQAPPSALVQPEIAAILDVAAAYFSQEEPLQGGAHDPRSSGFNWQQLELSLRAAVDPYLRFDSNLVFSPFGVEVEEAYATTLSLPVGLQARFGQFLTRFGRANATHLHSWDFVDHPLAITRRFGAEGARGLGLELSLLLPLPWSVELVGSATDAAGEESARSFYGADDLGVETPKDLLYTTAVKQFLALSHDWSLAIGLSGSFGPNSSGRDNRTAIYGGDVYLKYRPLGQPQPTSVSLHAEWFHRRRELPGELLQDYGILTMLSWRFAPRWAVAFRHEADSAAYDVDGRVTSDPLDPEWRQLRKRYALSLSFFPSEFSRFRLQQSRDVPGYREPIWATVLAAEVVVGAHGAHQF